MPRPAGARGPVNLRPSLVEACVFYSLIGRFGPSLAFNDGMRDLEHFPEKWTPVFRKEIRPRLNLERFPATTRTIPRSALSESALVRIVLAPRTVLNAEPPGSVSNYQVVNLKLVDVILEALAHFNPARALANSGSSSVISVAWARGRPGQATLMK